jgi:predicted nucleotidyltransferase
MSSSLRSPTWFMPSSPTHKAYEGRTSWLSAPGAAICGITKVEQPLGTALPPTRTTALSVWAFDEIFTGALALELPTGVVRIPDVPGFAAAKLGAWLDRSLWLEAKDATDLALVLYWYAESTAVAERLYETADGNEILLAESTDVALAAAHLLGVDVTSTLGQARSRELLDRWPGNTELLLRELVVRGARAWPGDLTRRSRVLGALTRGLRSTLDAA